MNLDFQVRFTAFNWFSEQVNLHGDSILRALFLKEGKYGCQQMD